MSTNTDDINDGEGNKKWKKKSRYFLYIQRELIPYKILLAASFNIFEGGLKMRKSFYLIAHLNAGKFWTLVVFGKPNCVSKVNNNYIYDGVINSILLLTWTTVVFSLPTLIAIDYSLRVFNIPSHSKIWYHS